jgi:hypothetical protein
MLKNIQLKKFKNIIYYVYKKSHLIDKVKKTLKTERKQ